MDPMEPSKAVTSNPLAVGCGTFVGSIVGEVFYHDVAQMSERGKVFALGKHGTDRIEDNAARAKREIAEHFGADRGVAALHSQFGLEGLVMMAYSPRITDSLFSDVVLFAVPAHGSGLSSYRVPIRSVREMKPGSRFMQEFEPALDNMMRKLSGRTRVVTISSVRDFLVPPPQAYIEGAENYCIAPSIMHGVLRRMLPGDVTLVDGSVGHTWMVHHPRGRQILKQVLVDRSVAQPKRKPKLLAAS